MATLYENINIRVEIEESEIPWLKIFTQLPYKEMSELPKEFRYEIYDLINMIEEEMIAYFNPKKINIAEFGNYLPHLHWHIMARFEEDSYYPEPMWGEKQRDAVLDLPSLNKFYEVLKQKLKER
jgi:diadenosine tetraphosphate (Ap4A) HIT family hydrolase